MERYKPLFEKEDKIECNCTKYDKQECERRSEDYINEADREYCFKQGKEYSSKADTCYNKCKPGHIFDPKVKKCIPLTK